MAPQSVAVDSGEHVVGVVESDGSDAVAVRREEVVDRVFGREVAAGAKKRVPEVAELLAPAGESVADRRLAADDVGFEFFDGRGVEIRMRVGVVAEIGSGIEPHIENFAQPFSRQFSTAARIHETDDRNFLLGERAKQLGIDGPDVIKSAGTRIAAAERKIIDGDRHLTMCGICTVCAGKRERHRCGAGECVHFWVSAGLGRANAT